MMYVAYEIGLCFVPRISVEVMTEGLATTRQSHFTLLQSVNLWDDVQSRPPSSGDVGACPIVSDQVREPVCSKGKRLQRQLVLLGQCCICRCRNTTWHVLDVQLILVG